MPATVIRFWASIPSSPAARADAGRLEANAIEPIVELRILEKRQVEFSRLACGRSADMVLHQFGLRHADPLERRFEQAGGDEPARLTPRRCSPAAGSFPC